MSAIRLRLPTVAEVAERIARSAHAGQVDKVGAPYIEHVSRVAAAVRDADPETEAVGWLHDVLEDTDWTVDLLVNRAGIPLAVAGAALIVTRRKAMETYAEFINRIVRSGDVMAMRVKLADLKDHLNEHCPPHLRPRYERAIPLIEDALLGGEPVLVTKERDSAQA